MHNYSDSITTTRERCGSYSRSPLGVEPWERDVDRMEKHVLINNSIGVNNSRGPAELCIEYDPKVSSSSTRSRGPAPKCRKVCRVPWCLFSVLIITAFCAGTVMERSHRAEVRRKLEALVSGATLLSVSEGIKVPTWAYQPLSLNETCPLIYTLDKREAKKHGLVLLDEELELLGTLMVRICSCTCPFGESQTILKVCSEDSDVLTEVLKGANVVVEGDNGIFYRWFKDMQDSYSRTSSHYSMVPAFGVPEGRLLRTVLTGLDIFGDTWFQLEGANWNPARHPIDSLVHMMNYVEYVTNGKQVGPLGSSTHTDKYPIRVTFDGCVSTVIT